MRKVEDLMVRSSTTVREAMRALDVGAVAILLLVDEAGVLHRTVTDGDLRRLLMSGGGMDDTLGMLPSKEPAALPVSAAPAEVLALMDEKGISQVPLLDQQGRAVGLLLRKDIDKPILLSSPHMGEHELEYVKEAFTTNWIAPLGPNVDAFEAELASKVGIAHAAAVSSGTAAIHLALILLGIGRNDRVYCSDLTFAATVNPIVYQGAEPVFIDSDPETWNLSPIVLERTLERDAKASRLPKALVVVNLYGQSADMDPIIEICDRYNVPVIEDAAESLGSTYKGRASGTFGRIGIYSFNGNKIITTSGGGMLISNDGDLVAQARKLSTQARDNFPYYHHTQIGYNYRMSNLLAGVGRGQLRVLDDRVRARRAVYRRYSEGFAALPGVEMMPEAAYGESNCWLSCIRLDPQSCRVTPVDLMADLARLRIEARHVWKPMHLQPVFERYEFHSRSDTENCGRTLFEQGVCLPSGSNMTDEQVDRVINALCDILGEASR
jgi:dTDP-4-amino-4,6-dideoxygalactose transaminase